MKKNNLIWILPFLALWIYCWGNRRHINYIYESNIKTIDSLTTIIKNMKPDSMRLADPELEKRVKELEKAVDYLYEVEE